MPAFGNRVEYRFFEGHCLRIDSRASAKGQTKYFLYRRGQTFGVLVATTARPLRILEFLTGRARVKCYRGDILDATKYSGNDGEGYLNTQIGALRRDLGDNADNPKFIERVPGQGYRFLLPVETIKGIDGERVWRARGFAPLADAETGDRDDDMAAAIINEDAVEATAAPVHTVHPVASKFRTWTLPLGTGYFTGREQFLQDLHQALQGERKVLIAAGGGCGKTQAAIEYVRRFGDQYEDVLWIRASDAAALFARAQEVAKALGRPSQTDADVQHVLKSWLAENPSALLVFDNLDDPDLAKPFWPTSASLPFVLVTSRKRDLSELGPFHRLELKEWESPEAVEFLIARTKRSELDQRERCAMEGLADETGRWPLALEQAAAFIATAETSFADYLETYRRVHASILGRDDHKPLAGDYKKSVTITWKASVEGMPQAEQDLLAAVSQLAPHSNPFELFRCAPELLSEALGKALSDPDLPNALTAHLGKLQQYSLLRMDQTSRTFSLHKLLHEVIRLDQTPAEQSEWMARWIKVFSQFLPNLPRDARYQESAPYSRSSAAFGALFSRVPEQHSSGIQAARLAGSFVGHFYERGRWQEAEALALRRMEIVQRFLGADHPDTLSAAHDLGVLYREHGRYPEAESLLRPTLEALKLVKGTEDPDTLATMLHLGECCRMQGQYSEAEPLLRFAVDAGKRVLGEDDPVTMSAAAILAIVYWRLGREAEAEPMFLRTLEARTRRLGAEHPNSLASAADLAAYYQDQGRYGEAIEIVERCLQACEPVLGERHPLTLRFVYDLAGLYQDQGRYAEAETLFKRSLEDGIQVLGADHPETLTTVNSMAMLYQAQGRYGDAEPLSRRSLEGLERLLGTENRRTLAAMSNLGFVYARLGRYADAEPLSRRVLETFEKVFGPDHPDTIGALANLTRLYQYQERYSDAEPLAKRSFELSKQVLGPDHPITLVTMTNLARQHQLQRRYDESEVLYVRTFEAYERLLGADHPNTVTTLGKLAGVYELQERRSEAKALYERAISSAEQVLGTDHPDTKAIRESLRRLTDIKPL